MDKVIRFAGKGFLRAGRGIMARSDGASGRKRREVRERRVRERAAEIVRG